AYMRQTFEDRMIRRLKSTFPTQVKDLLGPDPKDERLRYLIRDQVNRAAAYGIDERLDLAAFVDLAIMAGLNFEEQKSLSWMGKVLRAATVPARAKMRLIFDQLPHRNPEMGGLRYPKENSV